MALTIPPHELTFRASRARGPGGQHVNKTSSRVEVLWDLTASTVVTDEERERLTTKLARRLDGRGRVVVAAERYRSQLRNREDAVERLHRIVRQALVVPKPRKKTKPSQAAVERRLKAKRERSDRKRRRGPVRPDDDA